MADSMSDNAVKFLSRFSRYVSGLAITFGVMVPTGWVFHIHRLKGIIPGQVAVKANTVFASFLLELHFFSHKSESRSAISR
jgi:hypothetical protein